MYMHASAISDMMLEYYHYRDILRDRWDHRKTLKQNLDSLGLAYDSNTAIPIQSQQQDKQVYMADAW